MGRVAAATAGCGNGGSLELESDVIEVIRKTKCYRRAIYRKVTSLGTVASHACGRSVEILHQHDARLLEFRLDVHQRSAVWCKGEPPACWLVQCGNPSGFAREEVEKL
jgi:hypothetical protein